MRYDKMSRTQFVKCQAFAVDNHAGQRYGTLPYAIHLVSVDEVVIDFFGSNALDLRAAAWLHDVLEDTAVSYNDVRKVAGEEVADIVYLLTDEKGKNRAERKSRTLPAIAGSFEATCIKIADRIANVRHSKTGYSSSLLGLYAEEHTEFCTYLEGRRESDVTRMLSVLHEEFLDSDASKIAFRTVELRDRSRLSRQEGEPQ